MLLGIFQKGNIFQGEDSTKLDIPPPAILHHPWKCHTFNLVTTFPQMLALGAVII